MSKVRKTSLSDTELLPAIERSAGRAFRAYPDLAWVADDSLMSLADHRRYAAMGTSWLASDTTGILGFLCAELIPTQTRQERPQTGVESGPVLHIWELAVCEEAQGAGVGSQLMRHAMDHAVRSANCTKVTLTTFRDVAFNAPFYRGLGFEIVEELTEEPRLQALLAAEAAHGLPIASRCAMRFVVKTWA